MTAPLISVVLPTYNRARILRRAMLSVLRQSFGDLELIVVDDGSTDGTAQLVGEFTDPRVRYVTRQCNGGVAAARNTGVRAARGRYLAFQDSDDEWLLDKLARQVSDLQPLDETTMSVCGLLRCGGLRGQAWLLTYPRTAADWANGLDRRGVLVSNVAYTQSWLVPRHAVLEAGGFDERLCIWDDWDLLVRLASRLTLRPLPAPLVVSERGSDSLSENPARFLHDLPLILDKYQADLRRAPEDHAVLQHLLAFRLCKVGRVQEARAALMRSIRLKPLQFPAWRLLARTLLGSAHVRRRFGVISPERPV